MVVDVEVGEEKEQEEEEETQGSATAVEPEPEFVGPSAPGVDAQPEDVVACAHHVRIFRVVYGNGRTAEVCG